jgi:hypothetical protein
MKTAPEYIKTLFETHADKEGNVKLGKQSLINLLANFHSQFSIGGEEAFEKYWEQTLDKALDRESIAKAAFLAAYSGEGIRVKEVKGSRLKNGDEFWSNLNYKWQVVDHVEEWKMQEDSVYIVRINPEPPK